MADTRKNPKEPPTKAMSLFVPPDVRELAEDVLHAGDYGTLTNTLRVSLRNQLSRLKPQGQSQPATSAA